MKPPQSLATVKREFTQTKVRDTIKSFDHKIAKRCQYLYDQAISWGAHPNEKALTTSLRIVENPVEKAIALQVIMLPHGGDNHKLALRRCAQIGLCALEIFALIYPERFGLLASWTGSETPSAACRTRTQFSALTAGDSLASSTGRPTKRGVGRLLRHSP